MCEQLFRLAKRVSAGAGVKARVMLLFSEPFPRREVFGTGVRRRHGIAAEE